MRKGSKFSASDFDSLDFTSIQLSNWTSDDHINGMIRDLVMNFIKKYKELDAELKRKKFAITIGDELPAGIIQMAKVYIAKKRKIGVGDKMLVATVTRVLYPVLFVRRICRSWLMVLRLTLC